MRLKMFLKPAMVISVSLVAGCGMTDTIDTSELPESDSALIQGASRGTALFSPTPVVIKSVDGKTVNFASGSVRVSPGIHTLVVTCYQSLFARNTHELTVSVQSGAVYTLSSQIIPDKISDGTADCEAKITRSGAQ